ncbi:MAG TPA: RIP metalloprotease RseP [Rhodocyclaceae bacterium]|nr:RIP metalloprotease RseP [Rhodocyclaceae bacterium]
MLNAPFTYLFAFVIALGLLVVVHEFGHFSVARLCGVKVLRFAVGFGRVVWSRRFGADATEFALCAIPLGGYVKMVDEREGEVAAADLSRAFNRQTLLKRALIVLAGPVANLLLAIALYWGLFMHGVEELRPILAAPPAASAAARAGVSAGDTVASVNGRVISGWEELRWEILQDIADAHPTQLLVLHADGGQGTLTLATNEVGVGAIEQDPLQILGLSIEPPHLPAIIGKVHPDTPASRAGLQAGDNIKRISGQPVKYFHEVSLATRKSANTALQLTIQRGNEELLVTVTPALVDDHGKTVARMGFEAKDEPSIRDAMFATVSYAPLVAINKAVRQTWETSTFTLRMIGRMIIGELSLKSLSGPVTIAEYAGQSAQLGLAYYIKFLALISISIGVLNLLPIPVLDGGHLMYYLAEFIYGKPLPESVFAIGQRIGLALLLMMMSVALFNDLNRQFFG